MCHESNRKGSEVSAEDADFPKGKWVQIAAVYSGKTVKLYQDRELVLEYELDTVDLLSLENQYSSKSRVLLYNVLALCYYSFGSKVGLIV
jgi:hypothetical protein